MVEMKKNQQKDWNLKLRTSSRKHKKAKEIENRREIIRN